MQTIRIVNEWISSHPIKLQSSSYNLWQRETKKKQRETGAIKNGGGKNPAYKSWNAFELTLQTRERLALEYKIAHTWWY